MIKEIKAILWGVLGIRKKENFEKDINSINPLKLILSGFIILLLFIFILIFIIKFMVL